MHSKHDRLDRFISRRTGINRRHIKRLLAQRRITVDGRLAQDVQQRIGQFSHVILDGQILQANSPRYIMQNKPSGVVSATQDSEHSTVVDLLAQQYNQRDLEALHIVGRLDFNSTGLLLLTNDGRWSRRLSLPEQKISKRYRVTLEKPITQAMVNGFCEGIYLNYEGITTSPATLIVKSPYVAEVCLTEGRYHQIKRMFGRFQNPVLQLHRFAVGNLLLDPNLAPGKSRELSPAEANTVY